MSKHIKIADNNKLKRDTSNNSVLSSNLTEFQKARKRKNNVRNTELRIQKLETDINTINKKLNLILDMLSNGNN